MIIVSQDKKRIIENLNLGISEPSEYNKNYVIYNTELGEDLGEYETLERAKEVLQDIITSYREIESYKIIGDKMYNDIVMKNTFVYEMPQR